ncbi:hypothetical protein [Jannaschia sp. LMIT008]|uniref:hypothetical protein n=1 Tax=Jannaschia maritima TaxID=3032585 RepID=UPI0028121156|nr:hypothetical protein [Jannaschia sp. LMIT008]
MPYVRHLASAATAMLTMAAPALSQDTTTWDGDGDGIVSPQEFVTAFGASAPLDGLDANGDAQLDAAEYAPLEAVRPFAEADSDADGLVGTAELNGVFFVRYDRNGSGTIDADELPAAQADLAPGSVLAR